MDLFKWVNVLDKKMTSLSVEPNLCTHLISPKSTCHRCVEQCPTKSISFTKKRLQWMKIVSNADFVQRFVQRTPCV